MNWVLLLGQSSHLHLYDNNTNTATLQVLRPGLQKGPWTQQEDAVVLSMVNAVGLGKVRF